MQLPWFVQATSNQEIDEEDEPSGPCIIRMDRLPRLKGIKVRIKNYFLKFQLAAIEVAAELR